MSDEENESFQAEGGLDVGEAARILPRLEKENIRFLIDPDVASRQKRGGFTDARIKLFIHPEDVPAWRKIRDEYFPV